MSEIQPMSAAIHGSLCCSTVILMGTDDENAGSVTEMQVVSVGVGDKERASALVCLRPDL